MEEQTDRQTAYSPEEKKVVDYLREIVPGIGAGSDPVGFLIASHRALRDDSVKHQGLEERASTARVLPATERVLWEMQYPDGYKETVFDAELALAVLLMEGELLLASLH